MERFQPWATAWVSAASLALAMLLVLAAPALAEVEILDPDDAVQWRSIADSPAARIDVHNLLADDQPLKLRLERVDPFAPGARTRVNGRELGTIRSERVWYRGRIAGQPDSNVALSVGPEGDVRGSLAGRGGQWAISNRPASDPAGSPGRMRLRRDQDREPSIDHVHDEFQCGNHELEQPLDFRAVAPDLSERLMPEGERWLRESGRYRVRVAFESDFSFFDLFGSTSEAQDYLGDLINFISGIYEDELDTELVISSISLWNSAAAQPWQNTGNPSPLCLLAEFGIFWNDSANNVDQDRTIAHFLTANSAGPGSRDGVAWRGVLCRSASQFLPFDIGDNCTGFSGERDDIVGDFAVSRGISRDYQAGNAPGTWDYSVVAHEIGHNFDSQHTHCYGIDQCFGQEPGCFSGPTSLPGPPGQGSGTLMSYCHTLQPGLSNVAPTLGRGHPFGNDPEQVPNIMRDHVVAQGQLHPANPRCPELLDPEPVFSLEVNSDGASNVAITSSTGHGGTTNYSRVVTAGSSIQLSAPPSVGGNDFDRWTGCDSTSGSQCTINSISADRSVTVNYVAPQRTLQVNSSGVSNVAISSSPSGFGGTTNYSLSVTQGTTVTLTAPGTASGQQFDGWSGCDSVSGASCTVSSISSNRTVTVTYQPPPEAAEISVSPASLATTLDVGETDQLSLQISNMGGGTLTWGIETALLSSQPTATTLPGAARLEAGGVSPMADISVGSARSGFSCADPDSPGMLINDDGLPNFSWGFVPGEVATATFVEGFAVGQPGLLNRICVAFRAADQARDEPFTFNVLVFDSDGPGGRPGSLLFAGAVTYPNVATNPLWFTVNTGTGGAIIDSGTVYIGVSYQSVPERVSVMLDSTGPGGEGSYFALDGGGWQPITDIEPTHRALMVRAQLVSGCDSPSDIDWLSVTPDSGSTAGGQQSDVTVTVDAGDLDQGMHEALLCLQSNDPDNPLIEVPVSVEVTGPVLFHDRFEGD